MNVAVLLGISALVLNLGGLLVSLWFDRRGLPAGWDDQTTPRKRGMLPKRLPWIALNLALLYGGALPALVWAQDLFPMRAPGALEWLTQTAILVLADDLWFYWSHRTLHVHKGLYRLIHKRHHEAYAPVPIEYIYVHPLEWMLGAVGPALIVLGILLVQGQMSAWTFVGWQIWRTVHELDIHSGIRAPITRYIPLFAGMRHHDLHHAKPTKGNYASSLTLWDRVFRTLIVEAPRD